MIKWGIIGAGWIAEKFASDFKKVKDSQIVAVAARDLSRAESFAQKHNIKSAYGDYLQLVEDKDVDIVYIATTHNFHLQHSLLCLEHNKHVLCEKPITVNFAEFDILQAMAQKRGLFLMEAMWTTFLPAIVKAREWIKEGKIGDIKLVQASLGFELDLNPDRRNVNPNLAGGALLDIGIYPLSFGRIMVGSEVDDFQIIAQKHDSGVDKCELMQVKYKNGILGQFAASNSERYENDGVIIGTKGRIIVKDFHMTKKAILKTEEQEIEFVDEETDVMGYNHEAQSVVDCLNRHLTQNPEMTLNDSAQILHLMDAMRQQIGLKYPNE